MREKQLKRDYDLENSEDSGYFTRLALFNGFLPTHPDKQIQRLPLMALKTRLANRIVESSKGLIIGTIKDVESIDAESTEFEREQIKFTVECQGTLKPINLSFWTGVTVNPDKYDGKLNKLTRLCLGLDLITPEDLKSIDSETAESIGEKLESIIGLKIEFKMVKAKKAGLNHQIDFDSIKSAA